MELEWLKPRKYRHFDRPVNRAFAQKATRPSFVSRHSFAPLLHYSKAEKRYKKCSKTGTRSIEDKQRPIKYASHRNACILSWYAYRLNGALDNHYESIGIADSVIAYRSLGKSNYDFSAEALSFALEASPVTILAFDVTGFFDNLDHKLLKERLTRILEEVELTDDWFKVFRFITQFHYVKLDDLKTHSVFRHRFAGRRSEPIATVREIKQERGIM